MIEKPEEFNQRLIAFLDKQSFDATVGRRLKTGCSLHHQSVIGT